MHTKLLPQPHADTERRTDVRRAMGRLKPRERALLWLAYAQGSSHAEIAGVLGVKTGAPLASIDLTSRWVTLPMTAMLVSALVASVAAYVILADE